jgi:hypothetical protein
MEKSGKGLLLRTQQDKVCEQKGLPVEIVADSQFLRSITGETVQLYYYTAGGVLTSDAGQAAGTVVVGKLAYAGVLTAIGDVIGTFKDTSLSFTSTALTREVEFPQLVAEAYLQSHGHTKANAITQNFSNGDYCVDCRTGLIYGKKASATTSLAATAYKISSQQGNVVFEAGDLEIGAVELKDADTDARANIKAANTARTTATIVLATQNIDASGKVMAAGDAVGNAPFVKPTDGITAVGVIATIGSQKSDVASVGGEIVVADNGAGAGVTKPIPIGGKYNAAAPTYTDGDVVMQQYDINGNIKTSVVAIPGMIPTTLTGGEKTVAVAGTAEALGAALATKSIYIRAKSTNTSFICVGDSSVDEATNKQIVLYANDSVTLDIADRATVYLDADVGTEGADYMCMS